MKAVSLIFAGVPLFAQQASFDFGYRFVETRGNQDAYRSTVNLGEGPKLFGLNLEYKDLQFQMNNWGGDPYNTMRLDAHREKLYRLTWQYRNLAYFNHLPSYGLGREFNDLRRRWSDLKLELRRGSRLVPYFGWTHDKGSGRGLSSFVVDSNEYSVSGTLKDRTDLFRGGLRLETSKWHWALEQGGSTFKQDDMQFNIEPNRGNRSGPFLGEQLLLTDLKAAYDFNGNTIYSKAVVTGNPYSWLDVSGQFLYSQPRVDGRYDLAARGRFVILDTLTFQNSLVATTPVEAKQPHTSGSMTAEIAPASRVRIVESWFTDRFHDAARLEVNYSQVQSDAFFDVTGKLTLRGGHRYAWGDAGIRAPTLPGPASGELRRHVGLGGINYRLSQKLLLNADYEASAGDRSYLRTSLHDYRKARTRATFRPRASLSVTASAQFLENRNPLREGGYEFSSRSSTLAFAWTPAAAKRFGINGSYTRAAIRSEVPYLIPQDRVFARSLYRENAHLLNAFFDCNWHGVRLSAGGAAYLSAGSRPTEFYQPVVRLLAPIRKHLAWKGEWRWNALAGPEAFGAHLVSIGLVVSR